jgi:hypothetical protein
VNDKCLYGSEAVLYLCSQKGVTEPCVEEVNIPGELFIRTKPGQWIDVCNLVYTLEMRNDRVTKLASLNVPKIILINERRMLKDKVEQLENNNYHGKVIRYNNGVAMRSLNDLGYSLLYGWDDGMKAIFAKEQEEIDQMMQDAEFEDEEAVEAAAE